MVNLSFVRLLLRAVFAAFSTTLAFTPAAQAGPIGISAPYCNCSVDMKENGGPVLTGTVETFAIFYGDFTSANAGYSITAQQGVSNWLSDLNGTSYLNIASTYTGAPNGPVSTDVTFNGSYQVPNDYLGTSLNEFNIYQIVHDAKTANDLPTVANAIYFVFTAPEISLAEPAGVCGWHTSVHQQSTVYSWIGAKGGACNELLGESPSGNPIADEFTETGSHELFEALTDPWTDYQLGYFDLNQQNFQGEVADVCVNSPFVGDLHGDKFGLASIWTLDPSNPRGGTCAQGFVSATAAVPEPATWAMMLLGFLGIGVASRRAARTKVMGA